MGSCVRTHYDLVYVPMGYVVSLMTTNKLKINFLYVSISEKCAHVGLGK